MDGRCLERSVEGEKVPAQGEKLRWPVFSIPNFCSYSRLTQVQSLRQILFFQDIRTLSQYCLDVILKMHAITSGSRRQLLNHWNFVIFQMFQMLEIFQLLQMLQICKSSIVAFWMGKLSATGPVSRLVQVPGGKTNFDLRCFTQLTALILTFLCMLFLTDVLHMIQIVCDCC